MSDSNQNIKFSIIICTFNREPFLPLAFESILKQTLSRKLFEIIIVDNNSTDSTPQLSHAFIKDHPDIQTKYVIEKNQGLSFARNRGITESTGEYITFMDDDALLAEDFSEKSVTFFDEHKTVSAIGGKILLHYMKEKPFWYNPYLASLLGYFNPGNTEKPFRYNYFRGSNMSFKRALFKEYEPFNTGLGRVGRNLAGNEEKEMYYRLKNGGEQIWYVPSAVVYHLVPEERTGMDFIRQQGIGTGYSQRKMALIKGKSAFAVTLFKEFLKWITTILLALGYFITFRRGVASVLLKFRGWVSSGIFGRSS